MRITVRFFASLREFSGIDSQSLDCPEGILVTELWSQLLPDRDMPANTLAAVNMEYVTLQHTVKEGDEVAFFPPVTGG